MFDIVDSIPTVVRSALESAVEDHASGKLALSELDKKRIISAYQLIENKDPFAMSDDEIGAKVASIETRMASSVGSITENVSKLTEQISTISDTLSKIVGGNELDEKVKNLVAASENLAKRLEILEQQSGVSQVVKPSDTVPVESGATDPFKGIVSGKFKHLGR